eukprot:447159-Pyramimonas_sp.AAC.1
MDGHVSVGRLAGLGSPRQAGQYQLSSGISVTGLGRQYMWKPRSQPSQSSIWCLLIICGESHRVASGACLLFAGSHIE